MIRLSRCQLAVVKCYCGGFAGVVVCDRVGVVQLYGGGSIPAVGPSGGARTAYSSLKGNSKCRLHWYGDCRLTCSKSFGREYYSKGQYDLLRNPSVHRQ